MVDHSAVGRRLAPVTAHVEPGRLRFFRETLGESNPVYNDAAAAKAAGYAATPVPPTYLFCLEMMDAEQAFEFLTVLGADLAQVLHGEQRFAYKAPVMVGDTLLLRAAHCRHHRQEGRRDDAGRRRNQGDQPARRARRGLLPHGGGPEQGDRMSETHQLAVGDRVVHKTFPPISRHKLALYCGASGDHNPIHVDLDFAKAAGYPDVFAHGMLVMACLGQALTDAIAPARLRTFATRFVSITQLGARLTCEGHVAEFVEHEGERCARLALTTKDENGDVKLAGEAVIAI